MSIEEPADVGDLIGKFVFLAINPDHDEKSSRYHDGEHIVVQQTPHALYCVKPTSGYNFSCLQPYDLIGKNRYEIISVREDDSLLANLLAQNDTFVANERGLKGNRRWCAEVSDRAESHVATLRRHLAKKDSEFGYPADDPEPAADDCLRTENIQLRAALAALGANLGLDGLVDLVLES